MSASTQEGLLSRSFLGLVATQFLTVFNDNAYRWLIIPIGYELWGQQYEGLFLSVGLACFVIPYVLLPGPAGYVADRFSKRTVMATCMAAQALILCFGIYAILSTNVVLAFSTLALMGAQGAMLAPAKGGCIPDIVPPERISMANGVTGFAMISASVLGSVAGNLLYVLTRPAGLHHWWLSAYVLIGAACLGWASTLAVRWRPAADRNREFLVNQVAETLHDLRKLAADHRLLLVALASAFFWFLAALSQVNVYLYGTTELHIEQAYVGPLLGLLALGAGVGSVVAGVWSAGRIDLGIVPLSTFGIIVSAVLLWIIPSVTTAPLVAYGLTCVGLLLLGLAAGMYDVPLQAFLQQNSPLATRGGILAAANFMSFSAMLVASIAFWVLRSVLSMSGGQIFLVGAAITVPVLVVLLWIWRDEAAAALARPFRHK
jgi:acyl-[acyl-carrier-protein]-phospholipid O-acyltransferase/long-chain-fatty-acid--[acyl-carrier-protein] ligase